MGGGEKELGARTFLFSKSEYLGPAGVACGNDSFGGEISALRLLSLFLVTQRYMPPCHPATLASCNILCFGFFAAPDFLGNFVAAPPAGREAGASRSRFGYCLRT